MQLWLLHVDDALNAQTSFIRACDGLGARQIRLPEDGRWIRIWGYHTDITAFWEKVTRVLNGNSDSPLTFMGSGDFHHVSALLLASASEHYPQQVTLIHFDNHPDWVKFEKGIHCGSWINRALARPQVQKVITIGVCSDDLERPEPKLANLALLLQGRLEIYPYDHPPSRVSNKYGNGASFEQVDGHLHWKTIRTIGEQNFLDYLLSRIKTEAVYITIDKDVLAREAAVTNWDQGCMRLPYLLSIIKEIGRCHRVIGADVIGDYSKRCYSGGLRTRLSKHYEILRERPRAKPDLRQAADVNASTNCALLDVLSAVMR